MGAERERVEMNQGVTKPPQNGAGSNTASGNAVKVNFEPRSQTSAWSVKRFFSAASPLLLRVK